MAKPRNTFARILRGKGVKMNVHGKLGGWGELSSHPSVTGRVCPQPKGGYFGKPCPLNSPGFSITRFTMFYIPCYSISVCHGITRLTMFYIPCYSISMCHVLSAPPAFRFNAGRPNPGKVLFGFLWSPLASSGPFWPLLVCSGPPLGLPWSLLGMRLVSLGLPLAAPGSLLSLS